MRRPCRNLAGAELTHLQRQPIDDERARQQHAAYRAAVEAIVDDLIDLPALEDYPDSVFVEDALIAFPECFVLTRPGAVSRRREPDLIAPMLPGDRPVHRIDGPATLDGGDVLRIGERVFVGLSTRTNQNAVQQLAHCLSPHGYQVIELAVGTALHLKTAVTSLDDRTVVLNSRWINPAFFSGYKVLNTHPDEPFGANILRVSGHRFAQRSCARTAETLNKAGFTTTALDISEFAKAEAGPTCMSVVIPPAA